LGNRRIGEGCYSKTVFEGLGGRRGFLKVATGQITGSALVLLPLAALVDRPWTLPMPSAHAWEAWVGITHNTYDI
jgi:hypothetical protein